MSEPVEPAAIESALCSPEPGKSDSDSPTTKQGRKPHYLESETIKVIVGKEMRVFFVHRGLLSKAKFFNACLNSGYKEGEIGTITLEDDEPDIIQSFIEWSYMGRLAESPESTKTDYRREYLFADKICNEEYCNDIMDAERALDRKRGRWWTLDGVNNIYRNGLRNTPYGHYAIKSLVWRMLNAPEEFAKEHNESAPFEDEGVAQVFEDILKEIVQHQRRPYDNPDTSRGCRFHTHTDGRKCFARQSEVHEASWNSGWGENN